MLLVRLSCLLYVLLVIYCSLLPWSGWHFVAENPLAFLTVIALDANRKDLVVNVLVYAPLGLLLFLSSFARNRPVRTVLLATLAGCALSISMETLQQYVPSRDTSTMDVITNTAGTLAGAVLGALFRRGSRGERWLAKWLDTLQPGGVAIAGVCALGMWLLSQLSPFVPVMEREVLRDNLKPAWEVLHGTYAWRPFHLVSDFFYLAAALQLTKQLRKERLPGRTWRSITLEFAVVAAGVLIVQPFIYKHQLSWEAMAGLALAVVFTSVLRTSGRSPVWTLLLLLAGFVAYEIEPTAGSYTPFNWVPFLMQNEVPLTSLNNILATTWPFLAAGCALALAVSADGKNARRAAVLGGFAVLLVAFAVEMAQTHIRGRYGDVTTVMLALLVWTVPWFLPHKKNTTIETA
jgi:VanZ family protein